MIVEVTCVFQALIMFLSFIGNFFFWNIALYFILLFRTN